MASSLLAAVMVVQNVSFIKKHLGTVDIEEKMGSYIVWRDNCD